ncbi:alpha/beta fold hydrolase [Marinospirillum perlucidum]|uniref:alpha/beta fold hydrolase n=1 Tax=Marinospirillum perlucidum TaxID=1982602 RepID=UPI000DF1A937|nr:alpha/beta hydrolase [Marinospirillum perlucidum]
MPSLQLHFAPANGFPGSSYLSLLEPLRSHYRVTWVDQLGHRPEYPVNANWQNLVSEYLQTLPASDQPLIGVGHSLGGVITYMAALQAPEKFSRLLLLDPPLLTGLDSLGLKLAKRLGFIDRVTPAGITRGRRNHWPDKESALSYFQSKALFRNFDPKALQDYVQAGMEPDPRGGYRLRFQPQVEVAIFRNLADNLTGSHRRHRVPIHIIYGQQSDLITAKRARKLRRMGFDCQSLPGGHMFPLEHPEATRQLIRRLAEQRSD